MWRCGKQTVKTYAVASRPSLQSQLCVRFGNSSGLPLHRVVAVARATSSLAVFWDARGRLAPPSGEAARLWASMKKALSLHGRILERRFYFDEDLRFARGSPEIVSLEMAGFDFANCSHGGVVSLDKRLTTDVMSFACRKFDAQNDPIVAIITSDPGYAYMLNKIRDMGVKTILISSPSRSEREDLLQESADVRIGWSQISESSTPHGRDLTPSKCSDIENALTNGDSTHNVVSPEQALHVTCLSSTRSGKDKPWDQLTIAERSAAETLGYDCESWDLGETPASSARLWSDLQQTERSAASLLGYGASEWDTELQSLAHPVAIRADLQQTERSVASLLGYGASEWDTELRSLAHPVAIRADTCKLSDELNTKLVESGNSISSILGVSPACAPHGQIPATCSDDLLEMLADDIELGLISAPSDNSQPSLDTATFINAENYSPVSARSRQFSEPIVDDRVLHRMLHGR